MPQNAAMGSLALGLDHHGQGTIVGLTFHMPTGDSHELPISVGIGGLGHFPKAEINALRQDDVEKTDPVLASDAGAQMREGFGKSGRDIDIPTRSW